MANFFSSFEFDNLAAKLLLAMKKSGLIIIGLLITASVCAQNYDAGIKGGLNLTGLSGDMEDTNLKTAFHLGIFGQLMLSDNYTLQPELIYSGQGSNLKDSDYSFSLRYLNIPVIGKFYVTDQVNFQIGPQIGFLLGPELKNGIDLDIDEWTKGTSLAVALGIGYDYDLHLMPVII